MKNKRSIRRKIILYILSVFSIFYLLSIGYIVISSRQTILHETLSKTEILAENSAGDIEKFFEKNITITRTLAQAFSIYQTMPVDQWSKLFLEMYLPIIKANPHVYIVWDSWEYNAYVPGYTKDHGRMLMYVLRDENTFVQQREERSMDGDPDIYGGFKKANVDDIWEPYLDVVEDETREARLMTTIASPVQINGRFVGLIGLDVELIALQELVKDVKTVDGGYAFMVSNTGIIAGHPDGSQLFKNISDLFPIEVKSQDILNRVQKGQEFSFVRTDGNGNRHYMFFAPVKVEGIEKTWSLAVSIPYKQIMMAANRTLFISLGVGIFALLVIVIVLVFISNNLTKPIVGITESLKKMAQGEMSKKMILEINSQDEIQEMAEAFNRSIEGLNQKTSFALDIGVGKLNSNLELLGDNDILGKSLIDMRNSLKEAKEEEEMRKIEDQKRAWANEGFAKFGDILRHNNDNVQILSDEIVKNLVKYLNANQAGLFLLNDDDQKEKFFELTSAYAWDRKKYFNKKVEISEGLVGACAMEKETIQLTEIPEDYVEITSGLGKATPRYIVLVPLKQEETVLGVIEMASFKMLEQYEVDFLERVAQSIASTILSVRINAKTRLLLEQSQQQAEEMLAQEEEMRQNLEELQATQEEMERKRVEQQKLQQNLEQELTLLNALMNNIPDFIYFKNEKSQFIRISKSMVKLFNALSPEELAGKSDFDFHTKENAQKFFKEEQGIMQTQTPIVDKVVHEQFDDGREQWVSTTKMPLFDSNNRVVGTWGISKIITNLKKAEIKAIELATEAETLKEKMVSHEEEYQAIVKAIDSSTFIAEYHPDGIVIRFNEPLLKILGKSSTQVAGKHHSDFFKDDDDSTYNLFWNDLRGGVIRQKSFEITKGSTKLVLNETYSPVRDSEGNIAKIIAIALKA